MKLESFLLITFGIVLKDICEYIIAFIKGIIRGYKEANR